MVVRSVVDFVANVASQKIALDAVFGIVAASEVAQADAFLVTKYQPQFLVDDSTDGIARLG